MNFISDIEERSIRTSLSVRRHLQQELDAHPGWWIPSLAACLIWALLPGRSRKAAH